ncbi:hypothetical protein LTR53_008268 [Teratosphaeriaceae sp. CCFEE 6253]|nr:hypothetical protein LTR53_008268 [Teratosphaeriaceae sp. CCFEE 6253]
MPKSGEPRDHRKPCTLCQKPRDVLIRCQIDETGKWHFVCPGSCWKQVSGGVVDGDTAEEHKWYKYGGMWKNKHEAVSAKMPKARSGKAERASARMAAKADAEGGMTNADQDDSTAAPA